MSKRNDILAEAQRLAQESNTWADLSNALFDPLDGLVARSFPDQAERAMFRQSDVYDALHLLVEQKMRQTGVLAGAEPTKSGRFVVRIPRSMHVALEREVAAEGTSLDQLVVAKLAAQLSTICGPAIAKTDGRRRTQRRVRQAKAGGLPRKPHRATRQTNAR